VVVMEVELPVVVVVVEHLEEVVVVLDITM
jgi:hypothetical protein